MYVASNLTAAEARINGKAIEGLAWRGSFNQRGRAEKHGWGEKRFQ